MPIGAFLSEQLDYIFFFYGLAFFLLAFACFSFAKEEKLSLPWNWLGYFGVIHGFNEWLDLAGIYFAKFTLLYGIRLAILAVSFLCLIEFSRRAWQPENKLFWPLFYLTAVILASLGAFWGRDGLNATIRYFLGLPGGLLTAVLVYRNAKANSNIRIFAVSFLIYALATGIIVRKAAFFPASFINQDLFYGLFGFPVQFLRGLCAAVSAFAIWQYAHSLNVAKVKLGRTRASRFSGFIAIMLTLNIILGFMFVNLLGNYAKKQVITENEVGQELIYLHISSEMERVRQVAEALSLVPEFSPIFNTADTAVIASAEDALIRYNHFFNMSVCYIMDRKGDVVVTSNKDDPDSFLGYNYSFRPYFKDALAKGSGSFLGLGITSGKRGYYYAYLLKTPATEAPGVVVVKKNTDDIAGYLRYTDYSFLVNPEGVIFLSSKPELIFRKLWPISEAVKKQVEDVMYIKLSVDKPMFAAPLKDNLFVNFLGQEFYVARNNLNEAGWSVVTMTSAHLINQYRMLGIIIILVISLLILAAFKMIETRENSLLEVSINNLELEKEISIRKNLELTLREANQFNQEIISGAAQGIVVLDKDFKCLVWNKFMENLSGLRSSDVLLKSILEVFPDLKEIGIDKFMATALKGEVAVSNDVYYYMKNLGHYKWLNSSYGPHYDAHGRIVGLIAIISDVTGRKLAETEVAKQREELNSIIDYSPTMIFYKDKDNRFIRVNTAMAKAANLTKAQMEGRSLWDIYPKDEADKFWDDDKEVMGLDRPKLGIVEQMHTPQGLRFVHTDKFPYRDGQGNIVGVVGFAADITEHKKAEDALRKSEERFRTLVSNIPGAIYRRKNDKDWTMDFISYEIREISGYPASDFIANRVRAYSSIIYPDDKQMVWDRVQQAIRNKEPYILEYRVIHVDGSVRWVYEKGQGIFGEGDNILWLDGAIFDITSRRLAEENLKRAKEYAEQIFRLTPSAIFTVDKDRIVTTWNRRAQEITGFSQEEVVGKLCTVFAVEPCESACGLFGPDIQKPIIGRECTIRRKDGRIVYILKNADNIRDANGAVIGGIESFEDITERKRIDELKNDFVSTVSHELRTPLSIMKEGISQIKEGLHGHVNEKQDRLLAMSLSGIDRITRIVSNLLDLSKIESGKIQLKLEPANIAGLAKSVTRAFDSLAQSKKLNLVCNVSADKIEINIDKDRITEIFVNLINNAIKFTERGSVTVFVIDKGEFVECGVADTGIGIAADSLPRLFTKFEQFGRSNGPGERGVGLGLAICKGIVDLHKGKIWAESELGSGTKIVFALPRI